MTFTDLYLMKSIPGTRAPHPRIFRRGIADVLYFITMNTAALGRGRPRGGSITKKELA